MPVPEKPIPNSPQICSCGCGSPARNQALDLALSAALAQADARAAEMPDEASAIAALNRAYQRLKDLGWAEPQYCPKDGSPFLAIEPGCDKPCDATYIGDWPKGSWFISDDCDLWPSHPVLFRLRPEDEAKRIQALRLAAEKYAADAEAGRLADMVAMSRPGTPQPLTTPQEQSWPKKAKTWLTGLLTGSGDKPKPAGRS